ncbi:MAG: zinc-ribbon domain-containing protein [Myxococcales bacterium]|nr:zinc-ribbon domain-containing protein [Myxococcales bacterium]
MKIVCDNCATKYQIADEKVSGKAFKIRCKKCGHVIVVNKSPGEAGAAAGDAGAPAGAEAPPATDAAAPSGDAVWHLVIDREQVGPMTAAEVQSKVKAGQADAETYGWREGFDDWLKLSAIEDFKSLFAGGAPASADPSLAGASPGADAPVRTAAPGAATIVSDGMQAPDLAAIQAAMANQKAPAAAVAAPAQVAAPPAASLPEPEPPMPSRGDGAMDAPVKSMMGARSENSVLFSLNNLSALAGSSGGGGGGGGGGSASKQQAQAGYASAQSEASGLIDIRAMAAATLGSPGGGPAGPSQSKGPADYFGGSDAPPVFTPLAPAVLIPSSEPEGTPKWVFALIGVAVVLGIGMIGVIAYLLQDSGKPTVATNVPGKDTVTTSGGGTTSIGKDPGTSATGNTADSPGTKPSTPSDTKTDTKAAPADTKKPSGKESGSKSDSDKKSRGSKDKDKDKDKDSGKSDIGKAPPEPAAPPPPPKKDAPPKKKDDLDSLLDSASSGSGGKPAKSSEKKDLPEQLSMSTIQGALKGVNVSSCKSEGASGTVMVKLTIKGDGKVSSASAQGGAPGGDCVAKAVKSARFGEFSGDPMTLTFPFIVR